MEKDFEIQWERVQLSQSSVCTDLEGKGVQQAATGTGFLRLLI